jgi:hypothetical protein
LLLLRQQQLGLTQALRRNRLSTSLSTLPLELLETGSPQNNPKGKLPARRAV